MTLLKATLASTLAFSQIAVGLPVLGKEVFHRLKVDETRRSFRVHVPKGYNGTDALPMVLVLHGALSNSFNVGFASKMSRKADKDRFFAVYPVGSGYIGGWFKTWNAGTCCGPARRRQVDDIAYIRQVIETMEAKYSVDPDRIYVTGMSNGAMMTYRIGIELADKVAAIAPVEGTMICKSEQRVLSSPVSVIAFHGEKDRVVPIEGGTGRWLTYRFQTRSADQSIKYWIEQNQCSSEPVIERSDGVLKESYKNDKGDAEVVLYRVRDGGHTWPGGPGIPYIWPVSKKVSATDAMCEFFWKHPKVRSSAEAVTGDKL